MASNTPYSADLGNRDPLEAMQSSIDRMRALMQGWNAAQFERTYAPGKWTARQILIHLAQSEIALGNRARMALATPRYASQAFDQDRWMEIESRRSGGSEGLSGTAALDAVAATNAMNRALFASLSAAERSTPFTHPEYGALTVGWIIDQLGGHLVHHLVQFEQIAKQ
jgi:DinB superfamily